VSRTLDGRSDLEEALAGRLRGPGRAMRIPEPIREHRFHPTRGWRFDFAWPEFDVAVEVEGGQWSGGRHTRGAGFELDAQKYNEAAIAGWRVLRVTKAMVDNDAALAYIARAISGVKAERALRPLAETDG
jgi:very-short-patch-repair endonuclease